LSHFCAADCDKALESRATQKRRQRWHRSANANAGEVKTAWIADYFDQARKRHIKTCKSKGEADRWLVEILHEVARGIHTPTRSSPTVLKAGEVWVPKAPL